MKFFEQHFRTFHRIYRWWTQRFSLGGRVVTGALLLTSPQLMELGTPMFLLWSALFSLITVVAVAASLWRPQLHVSYTIPEELVRGELTRIAIQVTNRSHRPAFQLSLGLQHLPATWEVISPATTISQLASGAQQTLFIEIRAQQRGKYATPCVTIETTFPLGLMRNVTSYTDRSSAATYVVPALDYELLAELNKQGAANSPMSLDVPLVSGDNEYVGSREYLPGIVPRRWDYACWARLGQPVVRTYADPCQMSVTLIVANETAIPPSLDVRHPERLEELVAMAATYSHHIVHGNGQLFAIGTHAEFVVLSHLTPVQQHSAVLRVLATVDDNSVHEAIDIPAVTTYPSPDVIAHRALLFCDRPGELSDKWCNLAIELGWDVQPLFVVPS
jgi:uncharacterized protein (DUF58 family)